MADKGTTIQAKMDQLAKTSVKEQEAKAKAEAKAKKEAEAKEEQKQSTSNTKWVVIITLLAVAGLAYFLYKKGFIKTNFSKK